MEHLRAVIQKVMGGDMKIEPHERLFNLGLDSLMAVELKNLLESSLRQPLRSTLFFSDPTVEKLTDYLSKEVLPALLSSEPSVQQSPDDPLAQTDKNKKRSTRQVGDTFPQLYNQQEYYIWYEHELVECKARGHVYMTFRICSNFDVSILQASLQALIDRHVMLRTTYTRHDSRLVQQIQEQQTVEFETIEVNNQPWHEVAGQIESAAQRLFNLQQGPMLRAHLFSQAEDDHVLLIVTHHIAVDATTLSLLLNELFALYKTHQTGIQTLSEITLDFFDFVEWKTEMLSGSEGERLWQYWQKQLEGALPPLNLPTDYPRRAANTHRGASYFLELEATLTQQLRHLARTAGATLYMVLMASFQILLHHYTQQDDILVATHTSNRTRTEFAKIVGFLADHVPIRTKITEQATFREIAQQVQSTIAAALDHQGYPMKLLAERLQIEPDPTRRPICQVWFNVLPLRLFQSGEALIKFTKQERIEIGDLILERIDIIPAWLGRCYELEIQLIEGEETVFGTFAYSTDLFTEQTIVQLINRFRDLLKAVVDNPDQQISELSHKQRGN